MRGCLAILLLALGPALAHARAAPAADHHQHVFSPGIAALIGGGFREITADDVVGHLDAAGIHRGVLLSVAYIYSDPRRAIADDYSRVKAENDWAGAQAARHPDRLVAFCGLNPLKDYALQEIARCAGDPGLRRGIKLHFGNSDVLLERPGHAAKVRAVFAAANARGMAIVVHLRARISAKRAYGPEQARAFLDLLAAAPDVPVQVAHMGGAGPGYQDPPAHEVMAVIAAAVASGDPRTRNLWFDVASVGNVEGSEFNARLAGFVRQVGAGRVLYGSDAATPSNLKPRESWAAFRKIGLSDEELARIASNVAPYLRPAAIAGTRRSAAALPRPRG